MSIVGFVKNLSAYSYIQCPVILASRFRMLSYTAVQGE